MNVMKIKKYTGIFIAGLLPIVIYNVFMLSGWGMLWAVGGSLLGIVLSVLLFEFVYKHPILQMIESEGLLVLTIDSTGIIKPYIAKVNPPYVEVKGKKGSVFSIFDRQSIAYLKNPAKTTIKIQEKDDHKELVMKMPKGEEHKYSFGFGSYPVLIYNRNLETFISKETLSTLEMSSSVKHLVFYLKKKTEELTSIMRDFARYVIEMSKPRNTFGFMSSPWFWIILLVVLSILALLFLPNITGGMNPVASMISKPSSVVNP